MNGVENTGETVFLPFIAGFFGQKLLQELFEKFTFLFAFRALLAGIMLRRDIVLGERIFEKLAGGFPKNYKKSTLGCSLMK